MLSSHAFLVADDTAAAREIIRRMLESEGGEVDLAATGMEALERFRQAPSRYSAVLLDLQMPQLDGPDAARSIRAESSRPVPLIAVTGDQVGQDDHDLAKAGFLTVVRKPFRRSELIGAICDALHLGIDEAVASGPAEREADDFADLPELLRNEDVDLHGALQRCGGDLTLLRFLMQQFFDEYFDIGKAQRQPGDPAAARALARRLHALKGEASNLGLSTLARHANFAEKALLLAEPAELHLQAIGQQIQTLLPVLRNAPALWQRRPRRAAPAATPSRSDTPRLRWLLARADLGAIEYLNSRPDLLADGFSAESRDRIVHAVQSLDYPQALLLLGPEYGRAAVELSPRGGARLLVVDDDPGTVRLIGHALQGLGSVRFALTGTEAIAIAEEWTPDLVLLDNQLPDIRGVEVCRRIKESRRGSGTSIVFLTAEDDLSIEIDALRAGAVDFISKPISPARVRARAKSQLTIREQAAEMQRLSSEEFGAAPIGLLLFTSDGRIAEANRALTELVALPADASRALDIANLFTPESGARLRQVLADTFADGRFLPAEFDMLRADGSTLPTRLRGRRIERAGEAYMWVSVEDLSERGAHPDSEALDRRKMLAIGRLTAGLTHEFNNLLGIIIGNLDEAAERAGGAGFRNVEAARDAATRAAQLVRSLRTVTRQRPGETEPTDVNALLRELLPVLTISAGAGMKIQLELCEDPLVCGLPPADFAIAVLDAAAKASKSVPYGGVLTLSTRLLRGEGRAGQAVVDFEGSGDRLALQLPIAQS